MQRLENSWIDLKVVESHQAEEIELVNESILLDSDVRNGGGGAGGRDAPSTCKAL